MKVENGHNVKVHYKGTLADGTEFDNSRARGKPLNFEVGSPRLIQGFSDAVLGMSKGETKTVTLEAESAYGPVDPNAFQDVPKTQFGEEFTFEVGGMIKGNGPQGPFLAKIHEIQDENVVLDFNHPLAGKDLTFEVELIEVEK
jgi:FKBP-type peptidyl-prolyl cis-trans isomerase 2